MASDDNDIQTLLSNAKDLVDRLNSHDETITTLTKEVVVLNHNLECFRKYRENVSIINEIAQRKPRDNSILDSLKDSERLKSLERENVELHEALIDHQLALELIMSKYRQQMIKLTALKNDPNIIQPITNDEDSKSKSEKICEMVAVIQKAAAMDDNAACQEMEAVARLQYENSTLKELLAIANKSCLSMSETKFSESDDK